MRGEGEKWHQRQKTSKSNKKKVIYEHKKNPRRWGNLPT